MTINDIKQRLKNRFSPDRKKYPTMPLLGTIGASLGANKLPGKLMGRLLEDDSDTTSQAQFSDLVARSKLGLGYQSGVGSTNHGYVSPEKWVRAMSGVDIDTDNLGTHGTIISAAPLEEIVSRAVGNIFTKKENMPLPIPKGVLAHEVGHAVEHFHQNPILRGMEKARIPAYLAGNAGGIYATAKAFAPGRTAHQREQSLNQASLFGAAGWAPTLFNEARATSNAFKLIRTMPELDQPAFLNSARKMLPRALGSYGVGAGITVAMPQLAKYLIRHQHRNDRII